MFFQQLINGLTTGSVYALIALGYTMIYGILGLINFAQGEIYMCGAFVAVLLLATGKVKFCCLPNLDRPGSNDQDLFDIFPFGHYWSLLKRPSK